MSKPVDRHPQFALKPLALAIALAAGHMLPAPKAAAQLPTGATIANGTVTISNPNANTLNVNQATPKAVIDWQTFNLGAGNTVNFNQPNATSVALNRIHQADPSVIAGALNANGRVYLVNQNGIIFSGTARINTGGLLASTLDIDEDQFVNSSIFAAIKDGKPSLSKDLSTMSDEERAKFLNSEINIQNGAQIKTTNGGSVLIFAPNITNDGKIETPDGQTLMAAAQDKVYLMVSDRDDDYRGLVVEVGIGGKVTNAKLGEIIAERGNVTLLGMAVNQQGKIKATTAVDLNGTVRLLARDGAAIQDKDSPDRAVQRGFDGTLENPSTDKDKYAYATRAGEVTLADGSSIEITPDSNEKTAPDIQTQNPSKVEIMGETVTFEKNSKIVAPAGEVIVTATSTPDQIIRSSADEDQNDTPDAARIFMDEGSVIDVSGIENVELEMSRNVLEVELRGNELKDSPLQRDGILRGKKVKVDLRRGEDIAIADISGAVAAIKKDVRERMTEGGSVTLKSTGDVVQKQGAMIDVSGGSIAYKAGLIESTKLISDGVVYDISEADPNRVYDGIVGQNTKLYKKWNITESYIGMNTQGGGMWVEGYTDGKNAGKISIDSQQLLLEGAIKADVIAGTYQRDLADRASGGELDIALRRGAAAQQELRIVDEMIYHDAAYNDQLVDVIDETQGDGSETGQGKQVLIDNDGDGIAELLLHDDMVSNSGLGKITVRTDGDITHESNAHVVLNDGAALALIGADIDLQGSITTRGGRVSLQATPGLDARDSDQTSLTLSESARIDVSGRFTNDYAMGRDVVPTDAIAINAGSVNLDAQGDLTLRTGSTINADGGAFISQGGKLRSGKGGNIKLVSEADGGADVTLDGAISSYALSQGGKLTIAASSVTIGDAAQASTQANGEHTLVLDNAFFQQGGFGSYDITANLDSLRADQTADIHLVQQNRVFNDAGYLNQSSGTDLAAFTTLQTLPQYLQKPGSLALHLKQSAVPLNAQGEAEIPQPGQFVIEAGAQIVTGVGGSIALDSDNSIFIDGKLQADGGAIAAKIVAHKNSVRGYDAAQSMWLGSNAQLISNAAWVEGEASTNGLRSGDMFDAGTITLDAQRGFIAIEQGAHIEASGASASYDAVATLQGRSIVTEQTAIGAAGTVELRGAEGILLDGDIALHRANASATGGHLLIGFSRGELFGSVSEPLEKLKFPQNPAVLRINSERESILGDLAFGDSIAADDPRLVTIDLDGSAINAMDLDVLTLEAPNRTSTTLSGNNTVIAGSIEFDNSATLDAARAINLVTSNLRVKDASLTKVESSVITVGIDTTTFSDAAIAEVVTDVSEGNGALVLSANHIDIVGNIGVDNVAELSLASTGDIRLRSNQVAEGAGFEANRLKTAGDINLLAQQVYPTTLSNYSIESTRGDGRITVARAAGDAIMPLSAAGRLQLQADHIEQGGVLRAPFGEIVLGDDDTSEITLLAGSLTSVSAEGSQIPLGRIQGEDLIWNYKTANGTLIIDGETLPDKGVALAGDAIDVQQNAQIDLSGNGDLYATEFVPGPGGSTDVLDGINAGDSFAILPALKNGYAPYDINEARGTNFTLGTTVTLGQDLRLANGQVLAAGEYTVLPARYALLDGAMLVTPVETGAAVLPGQQLSRLDGTAVVAGKRGVANSALEDANWSAFAIEPGTMALTRSQYVRKTATEFFTGDKALFAMPGAAGKLGLLAGSSLNIDGELIATHVQDARGARVDIAANNLLITQNDNSDVAEGTVAIAASDITAFGADSVLLGGIRTRDDSADAAEDGSHVAVTRIDVSATSTRVEAGAELQGNEFIFAASDTVEVGAGARITATTENTTSAVEQLRIDGDGALLQVSALSQALVQRDNEAGATGDLLLGAGSVLAASRDVMLDASRGMTITGTLIDSQGLTVSAQRIVLGDATNPDEVSGAILDTALLNALSPKNFTIRSRSDIDVASDIAINADALTLQAGNIIANEHDVRFAATSILTLEGNAQSVVSNGSSGSMALSAPVVQLGSAAETRVPNALLLLDAATVSIDADKGVLLSDRLAMNIPGDISITAPQITALDAADSRIDVGGSAALHANGEENALFALLSALGASFTLTADDVVVDSTIRLPTGVVDIKASEGNLTLASNARVSTAGMLQQFGDASVASPGGRIDLQSTTGDVLVQTGSVLDVSGAALSSTQGSSAGVLGVSAVAGAVALDGELHATSAVAGEGGALMLDASSLGNIDMPADFDRAVHLRVRQGDLTIAEGDTIVAHDIALVADAGSVAVAGALDATGSQGGSVAIAAKNAAVLETSGRINASATAADGRGGSVSIGSVDGMLALREGAVIDVSGGDNSASNRGINSIRQGEVHLRARRNDDHSVNVAELNATVEGAERIDLEAFDDSITATVIDQTKWGDIKANVDAFMASVTTEFIDALGNLAGNAVFRLLPGVEVRSDGDMTVAEAVDLSGWRYTTGDDVVPGVLTLRASGDLLVNASVSDGFVVDPVNQQVYDTFFLYFSESKVLASDASWAYNLMAGADVSSANIEATQHGIGDVAIGTDTTVRSGTGDIRVAAGRDVLFTSETSALYTAGNTPRYHYATPQEFSETGLLPDASYELPYVGYIHPYLLSGYFDGGLLPQRIAYGKQGGDINVHAGRNIDMVEARQLSSDWLQRYNGDVRENASTGEILYYANFWGVVADDFDQGVATLGGGNLTLIAGGDITNLTAAVPVTMRQNLLSALEDDNNPLPITGDIVASDDTYFWERNGGGDLTVIAGGDILSPYLLADHGTLSVTSGGGIAAVSDGNAALLSVSDTTLDIRARGDISIDAIFNTTIVPQSTLQTYSPIPSDVFSLQDYQIYASLLFSYSDDASASITSTGGDIVFDNSLDTLLADNETPRFTYNGFNVAGLGDLKDLFRVQPGSVSAMALSGDIAINGDMTLFPNQSGQLELLAKGSVGTDQGEGEVTAVISDADPVALPTLVSPLQQPLKAFYDDWFKYSINEPQLAKLPEKHAKTPVHTGDATTARVVAATGDIDGSGVLTLISGKKMQLLAGDDIRDITLDIQNANASDSSELRSGDDIDLGYTVSRATGTLSVNRRYIRINGPGRLDVIAGGDVKLGSSDGVVSVGDQNNPALADSGADVMVIAGVSELGIDGVAADYLDYVDGDNAQVNFIDLAVADGERLQAFFDNPSSFGLDDFSAIDVTDATQAAQTFAALSTTDKLRVALALAQADDSGIDNRDYTAALVSFILSDRFAGDALALASELSGQSLATREQFVELISGQSINENNALARGLFAQLSGVDQRGFLFDVVYDEVRKGGIESLTGNISDALTQGFARGYNAIESLFPGIDQNAAELNSDLGNISLVFSTIASKDGGDVNFFTPRGSINVGLAGTFAGLNKKPADLGLIAQGAGDIHGVAYGDININASRIFALDGGDILLWSSQNDIDAGKGAKTALSIPSPKTVYDENGEPAGIELPASVSGSGIQAAVYTIGRDPGSVYLFAPQGVIDAGDAGISSAGDLFLAATEVLGADNISFGGVSIGVPTTTGISASLSSAGDSATSSTAGAADEVAEKSTDNCSDEEDCEENNAVAFVTVEIIGLGD